MRHKWTAPQDFSPSPINEPVQTHFATLPDPKYRPKLLLKSPSMRAMKNYYNLTIEDDNTVKNNGYDNLSFMLDGSEGGESENKYDKPYETGSFRASSQKSEAAAGAASATDIFYKKYFQDFSGLMPEGAMSTGTNTSGGGSELNSERDMGSTVKLMSPGVSSKTWFGHLCTIMCSISMAAGLGNIYRLPQTTLVRGGLPFLVVYIILTILIGLPLLFLELGIGQLAQEGFIKSWRAVPFFKGVGYVKLMAGSLLSIYYPLYMGLSLYYVIWLLKGQLPFPECADGVKITEEGYSADGISGQKCLRKTFLKSPYEDPYWLGIFAGILFMIWIIITALSIRKTKSYIKSLMFLFFPTVACYVAITTKSVMIEDERSTLERFDDNVDWSDLASANTWYFAAIQVFFSTNVGFGSFMTNAGLMYNKVNPLWTALGYIMINLLFGVGSVLMNHILTGNLNVTHLKGDVAELQLMSHIYDVSINSGNSENVRIWAIITHLLFILAGFINMGTLTYTLLKAITVQTKNKLKWWQTSIVLSFTGFVLGCVALMKPEFDLVHLLDHYIVGNLILVSVIVEVFVFISFYGMARIKSDFEFMLGHILSKIWILLWWCLPILLTTIFVWGLATLPLEGIYKDDPTWLYGTGWAIVLAATIFIFIFGFITVLRQDGYTLSDKLKASLEPSPKWGPKDPILRHTWIQWNSKAQKGERDFTLKRRGTRDYTRSVKRIAKRAQANSDISTSVSGSYSTTNDQNHNDLKNSTTSNYAEPYYIKTPILSPIARANSHGSHQPRPLKITSLVDTLSPNHTITLDRSSYPGNINPLARPPYEELPDSSNSEGYGTFRKGPFVISTVEVPVGHVCHRKVGQNEEMATEL